MMLNFPFIFVLLLLVANIFEDTGIHTCSCLRNSLSKHFRSWSETNPPTRAAFCTSSFLIHSFSKKEAKFLKTLLPLKRKMVSYFLVLPLCQHHVVCALTTAPLVICTPFRHRLILLQFYISCEVTSSHRIELGLAARQPDIMAHSLD